MEMISAAARGRPEKLQNADSWGCICDERKNSSKSVKIKLAQTKSWIPLYVSESVSQLSKQRESLSRRIFWRLLSEIIPRALRPRTHKEITAEPSGCCWSCWWHSAAAGQAAGAMQKEYMRSGSCKMKPLRISPGSPDLRCCTLRTRHNVIKLWMRILCSGLACVLQSLAEYTRARGRAREKM